MSNDITIAELTKQLHHAGEVIDEEVAKVVKVTAPKVVATQQTNVKKRSGKTARSINAKDPSGAPLGKKSIDAVIGPDWFVGRLIETGTIHQAPFVYVANSLDPHLPAHLEGVSQAMTTGALKGLVT